MVVNAKPVLFEDEEALKFSLSVSVILVCLSGCSGPAGQHDARYIDRDGLLVADSQKNDPDSLRLIIDVDQDGHVSLNKIQMGSIQDLGQLHDAMVAIFNDRKRQAIEARDVIVITNSHMDSIDLEDLIDMLSSVDAQVRVIFTSDLY